jgi:hypothetical protein
LVVVDLAAEVQVAADSVADLAVVDFLVVVLEEVGSAF